MFRPNNKLCRAGLVRADKLKGVSMIIRGLI